MLGNIKLPPTPTEEQALDFMTETLRNGDHVGKNNYAVYLSVVADRYVRLRVSVPQGYGIDIEPFVAPFFAAPWALSPLALLLPAPTPPPTPTSTTPPHHAQ